MNRCLGAMVCALTLVATPAFAQTHGGGGGGEGGSTGCGDLFGDLVHVLRDGASGAPILQLRWIGYPADVLAIGFCPIPLDEYGNEIGFFEGTAATATAPAVLPTCDAATPTATVEVDYFGRLSAGRTKERNTRMHFDEVISAVKLARHVERDQVGRLRLEECLNDLDDATCIWRVIDTPQQNLALYQRMMRYGHIQTDPLEEDADPGGDPALGTQYRPALGPSEYSGKFLGKAANLLPYDGEAVRACFITDASAGVTTFVADCAAPEALRADDFILATGFLGGAADKTGFITVDLVQYLNRILKITLDTPMSDAVLNPISLKIRVCGKDGQPPQPIPGAYGPIPALPLPCREYDANGSDMAAIIENLRLHDPSVFNAPVGWDADAAKATAVNAEIDDQISRTEELFVDFSLVSYARASWFNWTVPAIVPSAGSAGTFVLRDVALLPYLDLKNPGVSTGVDIDGFVKAANDSVRAVEFVHNYAVPDDLGLTLKPLR